ncbi:M23 family metallopeptidase [Candidatus Liberibacter africanus]|uniref:murein hydrolase activator EnvC family protein n=1 Tax=Liberibacter africanus TaxID=34020 RepID=UPI001AE70FA7|nr:M23 family metallopeptidase [Candidatus Liberibacter africanus]QTP63778.1 M23 family metallopeptidase [Candidatus Liberibacter africanus]
MRHIPIPDLSATKKGSPKSDPNKTSDHIDRLKEKLLADKNNSYDNHLNTQIPLPNNLQANSQIEEKFKQNISAIKKDQKKNINNLGNTDLKTKKNQNKHIHNIYSISDNKQKKPSKYFWPVTGDTINFTKNNDGIDIVVPPHTPIKAAADGMVIYVGDDLVELGNIILIRHDSSTVTVYSHIDKIYVHKGKKVSRGYTIGRSGTSGKTKQSTIHFEFRKNTIAMDPIKFLEEGDST